MIRNGNIKLELSLAASIPRSASVVSGYLI
jgi:hypothetical protein